LGWGVSEPLVHFLLILLGAVILPLSAMMFVIFLIWYERKVYGRIQDRLGPNRVGPFGMFQTFADMGKIFAKELITPTGVDKVPYNLAPILSVAAVLLVWAVIPLAPRIVGADLGVGLLFAVAAGGFGELAIMMAGWGSNNKYALLGGFRAVALLISYEIPLIIVLLIPAMLSGSLRLFDIVEAQTIPFIVAAPAAAIIFFITLVAEAARAPFDITEAESEIVAGFNTEYSGLKFGMFFVAEFLHAFTVSMLFATIFLGGYRGPFVEQFPLLGFVYLFVKTFIVYFGTILFRGSLPRFRMDQMLDLNWKILTPLALTLVFVTAFVDKLVTQLGGELLVRSLVLLVVNLGILWVTSKLLTRYIRAERKVVSGPRPLATPEGASTGQEI
jgi:NADH-quinone oxidoreductase subunit H